MPDELYRKLADPSLLRKAWHLARADAMSSFIPDQLRYSDFAFGLNGYLRALADDLRTETYRPRNLSTIDVPKSSLSVRPGSILRIEDHIVLYAVVYLIAQKLDRKLPPSVYSCRVKSRPSKKELFKDREFFRLPFLKGKTIRRFIDIVEPWYAVWPEFQSVTKRAVAKDRFKFMVVSDISAYFENISLHLLGELLKYHLPSEPKLVNLLLRVLRFWTWPAMHGTPVDRGVPQGNDVSRFLANFFLLPLDKAFVSFARHHEIRYLRYVDDVEVLTKDEKTARQALFLMNNKLRELHLNMQGSKTRIVQGQDVLREINDELLDEANAILDRTKKTESTLTSETKETLIVELRAVKAKLDIRGKSLDANQKKQDRVFRRLATGFSLLGHPELLTPIFKKLKRGPDSRLIDKAVRYFKLLPRSGGRIARRLTESLTSDLPLFAYQEGRYLEALRYLNDVHSHTPEGVQRLNEPIPTYESKQFCCVGAVH